MADIFTEDLNKMCWGGFMRKTPLESWILNKIGCKNINDAEGKELRGYLEAYQLKKIKENIGYVKSRSIFYKRELEEILSENINSFNDFERIPFTTAQNIKKNPLHFLCVSQGDIERIVSLKTSGTSGIPKRIYFTQEDQELTIDFFNHGMKCLIGKEDRVLILMPGDAQGSVGDLLKKGLGRMDVHSFIFGPIKDTGEAAEFIQKEKINCIVGIPIQVLKLKREQSIIIDKYITRILLSTDYVPSTIINELSSEKCKVFTHYGMTEMGLGGGVECESLNGYHMREADLYFEIIDPDTGKNLKDGSYGEIVFTTLTRKGMPLIRYRTGDIGRFMIKPCDCGTILKTMDRVSGRIENNVRLFENEYLNMRELDETLLKRREIPNYEVRIINEEQNECDSIIIKLQMKEDAFKSLKSDIFKDLCTISGIKEGIKKGLIDVILKAAGGNIYTGNGTLKRKIEDYRRKV